jgi:hypothetical protein
MRFVQMLVAVSMLAACADTHQLIRTGRDVPKLESDKPVYVAVPKDGRYGQTVYSGSGPNTTQIVLAAFARYATKVESGHESQTFEEALSASRKLGATYLVVPTILEWEDRITEWSSIPDKASIRLTITDAATEATIDSVTIKGKSGLATLGGDHPQDLLPKPVAEYVKTLYQ